ncbi:MAG: Uncharacterized protein Athens101410_103 [Parcubacteria group bacterium Athens1014_10]|nr:MAG: Uncharacterized protein Athens101410_103 [Parcubacteria group bacterium Athens1014_10]TSD05927.1 MAG: Uncharacterized protein Athens071412_209 [Parcubacteria group bacterium Athens0714_12]
MKLKIFDGCIANGLKRELKELYLSTLILNLAISAVSIFEPIYLYTLGFSLSQIVLFFIFVYALYFFIVPIGANIARTKGYEHSIFYSSFFCILYYLSLFSISRNVYFVYLAILMLAVSKALYWPAYHADFTRFGRGEERSREISNLVVLYSIVCVVGPFLGGLIISFFGFKVLFMMVSFLILISNLPMLATKEVFTPLKFSYKDAFKRLFKKNYRKGVLAYLGYGEEFIFLVIWPVFIYLTAKNFFSIGSIIALSTLISSLSILYIGKTADEKDKYKILNSGIIFGSISWFLRIFTSSPFAVFLLHSSTQISQRLVGIPMMSLVYNQGSKSSIMKTIVFFEMSLVIGKLAAMLVVYLFLFIYPNSFIPAFVLAGLMTLLYSFITQLKKI